MTTDFTFKFKVGEEVAVTNCNGVKLRGVRKILDFDRSFGRPHYFISPCDTPWASWSEECLKLVKSEC